MLNGYLLLFYDFRKQYTEYINKNSGQKRTKSNVIYVTAAGMEHGTLPWDR